MKVTIHQPEHLPWLGYFDKMKKADLYVYLDNVQFRKNYFQNRNRIPSGWLTVPVSLKGHTQSTIKDIRINNENGWCETYWGKLSQYYQKCPYWDDYKDKLDRIIHADYEYIVDVNYALIDFFRECFHIGTPTVYASDMGVEGRNSELLLNICKKFNADTYLSGPSGRNYLNLKLFSDNGIGVEFHDYPHSENQLSAIDFVMRNKWA